MNDLRWDKRSWLLAFGGGSISSILFCMAASDKGDKVLNRVFPYPALITSVQVALLIISLLILPGIVSATAARLYFWRGTIPSGIFGLCTIVLDLLEPKPSGLWEDLAIAAVIVAVSGLLTYGPISFYRFTQRRKAERLTALQQAMLDAAGVPQEGVWPPPPQRGTNPTE